jgi:hypothetical protein
LENNVGLQQYENMSAGDGLNDGSFIDKFE